MLSKIALWLLGTLGVAALFVAACGASAWLHVRTGVGRRAFGDAVSGLVDREIPGRFRVRGVTDVSLPRVRAERIDLRTAEGREVMRLEEVSVELDASRSWRERALILRSAHVGGGQIEVVQARGGETTMEQALARPRQGRPPAPPKEPGRYVMDLDGLRFEHLRIVLRLGETRARLSDARGQGRLWLREGRPVHMRFSDVGGRLTSSVALIPHARVRDLSLAVSPHPGGGPVVSWRSGLETPRASLTVAGHAPRERGAGARMCLWTGGAPLASAFGIGAEVVASLSPDISFDMRLSRAPREPTCEEQAA